MNWVHPFWTCFRSFQSEYWPGCSHRFSEWFIFSVANEKLPWPRPESGMIIWKTAARANNTPSRGSQKIESRAWHAGMNTGSLAHIRRFPAKWLVKCLIWNHNLQHFAPLIFFPDLKFINNSGSMMVICSCTTGKSDFELPSLSLQASLKMIFKFRSLVWQNLS